MAMAMATTVAHIKSHTCTEHAQRYTIATIIWAVTPDTEYNRAVYTQNILSVLFYLEAREFYRQTIHFILCCIALHCAALHECFEVYLASCEWYDINRHLKRKIFFRIIQWPEPP